jgi:hypothetical protein
MTNVDPDAASKAFGAALQTGLPISGEDQGRFTTKAARIKLKRLYPSV